MIVELILLVSLGVNVAQHYTIKNFYAREQFLTAVMSNTNQGLRDEINTLKERLCKTHPTPTECKLPKKLKN